MNRIARAAVVQMNSSADLGANLSAAARLLRQAREQGAQLAALPENFAFMGARDTDKLALAEAPGEGPIQAFLAECARELQLWIIAGTVPLRVPGDDARVAPASLVYDAQGECVARYDKIHLFDVDLPERDERYRESATVAAGDAPVVAETVIGRVGLSVCYDLRFPELYRSLLAQGAQVLNIPAAFTVDTGRAHWEVLLRARAVENQSHVLAAAQVGQHANGRSTYGDALIVGPWGEVLARAPGNAAGIAVADIDLTMQDRLRERFPAAAHRRLGLTPPAPTPGQPDQDSKHP